MAKSHQRSASTQTHADKVGLDGIRGLFEHKQFYNSMVDWLEKELWSPPLNSKEGKPSPKVGCKGVQFLGDSHGGGLGLAKGIFL